MRYEYKRDDLSPHRGTRRKTGLLNRKRRSSSDWTDLRNDSVRKDITSIHPSTGAKIGVRKNRQSNDPPDD